MSEGRRRRTTPPGSSAVSWREAAVALLSLTMAGLAWATAAFHIQVTSHHFKANEGLGVSFFLLDIALMASGGALVALLALYVLLRGLAAGEAREALAGAERVPAPEQGGVAAFAWRGCWALLATAQSVMAVVVIGFLVSRTTTLPFSDFHGRWGPVPDATLAYEIAFLFLGLLLGWILRSAKPPRIR